jgi:hypothetical protein
MYLVNFVNVMLLVKLKIKNLINTNKVLCHNSFPNADLLSFISILNNILLRIKQAIIL